MLLWRCMNGWNCAVWMVQNIGVVVDVVGVEGLQSFWNGFVGFLLIFSNILLLENNWFTEATMTLSLSCQYCLLNNWIVTLVYLMWTWPTLCLDSLSLTTRSIQMVRGIRPATVTCISPLKKGESNQQTHKRARTHTLSQGKWGRKCGGGEAGDGVALMIVPCIQSARLFSRAINMSRRDTHNGCSF